MNELITVLSPGIMGLFSVSVSDLYENVLVNQIESVDSDWKDFLEVALNLYGQKTW